MRVANCFAILTLPEVVSLLMKLVPELPLQL